MAMFARGVFHACLSICLFAATSDKAVAASPSYESGEPAEIQSVSASAETTNGSAGQNPESTQSGSDFKQKKKTPRGSIAAARLPIVSPALGSGGVPVLGYIFPFSVKDKISPPSVVGAAGLITDEGSRAFPVGKISRRCWGRIWRLSR